MMDVFHRFWSSYSNLLDVCDEIKKIETLLSISKDQLEHGYYDHSKKCQDKVTEHHLLKIKVLVDDTIKMLKIPGSP